MKIIGHRGAAGITLENTLDSIRSAIAEGVDAIEIDVRLTRDGHMVLSHDRHTRRVSQAAHFIHESSLDELRAVRLHEDKRIATLHEALTAIGDTPIIIEAKGFDWAQPLAAAIEQAPKHKTEISVAAFNHDELHMFSLLKPDIPVYALDRWSPIDAIQTARSKRFRGVSLYFWVMSPLVYRMARRAGLEILVFTVNHVWLARFLKWLYPEISIITNHPHRLGYLSDTARREGIKKRPRKPRRKKS